MAQGNLIFISGGVRSGKSSFAESYAAQVAESKDKNLYYLATSLCFDDEMTKRIKHHQATRGKSIHNWQTIEASKDISEAVYKEHEDSVILLDCLTVWLSNEFYQKGITEETLVRSEERRVGKDTMYTRSKRDWSSDVCSSDLDEMTKRIKHHQATRGKSIHNWQTIEASKDISEAVYKEHEDSVILLDCLTVWLSNEFYQKGITEETLV